MFTKYYQDELQFLNQLGREFARSHPDAAHYLSVEERDPDVERLLQGFAFLAARVREKLDDEFPELTHGVMSLLWPHYLRPIPSMSMLEFSPTLAAMRQTQVVPRGAEVQSVPVEDGPPCRFRTCYEVALHPLSLEAAALETRPSGRSRLTLELRLWNQVRAEALRLDRLRLYLHGDPSVSYALYYHLCRHVGSAQVSVGPGRGGAGAGESRPVTLKPSGFEDDQALLPYPRASFPGYRHLQEYFALPQKFLFLDVLGLEGLRELTASERFQILVDFELGLPPTLRVSAQEIRLYCTPIVNLFPHEGDPARVDGHQSEYRVRPSGLNPLHYEIYSIDRVTAHAAGAAEERVIPNFYAFGDRGDRSADTYYNVRLKSSVVDERLDTYVSFADAGGEAVVPKAQTVSFRLTCTNRRLAEALRVGDIRVPSDSSPAFVQFRNLMAPTTSVTPPLGGDLHWRLISHLSLNYLPTANLEALRGVLELYNFHASRDPRASRANALRLEGLQNVRVRPAETLERGCLLRGTEIRLEVLEDHFAGEGDLFLFATMLNEFLSLHATLNSFTQLSVRGTQKGEVMSWPRRIGRETS